MAYAALLSLIQTTREIILDEEDDPILDYKIQQLRSIREPFLFFQEFLRDFPEKSNNLALEERMRDLAYEAEDTIVPFMLQVQSHWRDVLIAKDNFSYQMRNIRNEADSIRREVIIIKNSSKDVVQLAASSSSSSSSSSPVKQVDYVVDLHEDSIAIKSRLCGEPSSLQVIPIVGMGGIGKTTLAKLVYDDLIMMQQFDIHAWVTVTQDYSADAILSCLLTSVEKFHKDKSERSNELPVGVKVFRILKKRRYLIVLDDIWNVEAWDNVRNILPDDNNGSRIMLTTRLTDVASYPDPCTPLHEMRLMEENQSWNLLRKKVFDDQDCPPELEGIGKAISRSCKGLPLAVVVVAGLLSVVSKHPNSWSAIAKNIISVAIEGQFEKILLLSYTHLPPHLRSCFLYMGMFPEDCEFRVSKLIKLWAAEGFLTSSSEDGAEECVKNLVMRSLVLVTKRKSDGGIKSCSLHDLMRDLCIRKAHEEKFLVNFGSRYLVNSVSVNSRENQRCRRANVAASSLSRLSEINGWSTRSIFCSGRVPVENLLRNFRLLRVLDAGETYLTSLPDELFELVYLVYLAIYYLRKISPLLSKLENLQTLILHSRKEWRLFRAQAICLPQEIWWMPQLKHLIFYGRLPDPERRWPSVLRNLQTLSMVSQDMCTERILVMIPNLKKLEIHCSGGLQAEIFMKHLVHLRQLENLKIRSYFSYRVWEKDSFTIFPPTLRKLTLSRVPLPWDDMTIVGSLPNLRVLKLTHQSCKGNTWETTEGEFPQLEFLLIEKSELEYWITESSHFPMLKRLVLDECWQLTEIPEGIGEIPTLELIEVKGKASKSLVESAKWILEEQRELGNNDLQVCCMTRK